MKLNWGSWIAVVYTAFVVLIAVMVYLSFGEKWDLVTEDYYEQEIKYQEKINQKSRAKMEGSQPVISIYGKQLMVNIPNLSTAERNSFEGKAEFFRPSDANLDFEVPFKTENELQVPLSKFKKGKYLAKLSWEIDGAKFYGEQILIIP